MEAQKIVQEKLDNSEMERVVAEKWSEKQQEKMTELPQLLMNK